MDLKVPDLQIVMCGPEGNYEIRFTILEEFEGRIEVTIGDQKMEWYVESVDYSGSKITRLGGLTRGSEVVWGDCYWFELQADQDPRVDYYGSGVLVRTDRAAVF